ncbi:MAG: hypothetical protein WA194_07735 [Patescibacteria group bacterium]
MKLKTKLAIVAMVATFFGIYAYEAVSALGAMSAPDAAIAVASVAAVTGLLYLLGYASNSGGWNPLPFLIGAVFLVIHVLALREAPAGNPEFSLMFWALLNFGPAFFVGAQFGEWSYEKRPQTRIGHA